MNRWHRPAGRAVLALIVAGLALRAEPDHRDAAAATDAVSVQSDGSRVRVQSPFLYLELDLKRPALDVIQVAPYGNARYGPSLGEIVEEASVGGRRLRSADDADGARASWQILSNEARVTIEGVDLGGAVSGGWTLTIEADAPTLRIDRSSTVRGNAAVETLGLAITSPSVPEGTDPTSLAFLLNGAAYRAEVGPASVEQAGGLLGLLAVDNPELSYSGRSEQPDRVAARYEGATTTLAFSRKLAPRAGLQLRESTVFRFGWLNDFTSAHSDVLPLVESRLLASGYYGNAVISPALGPVLSASMRDYRGSVWSRDLDYAMQGYSYVLGDMSIFRNALEHFLKRVDAEGVTPENILLDGRAVNRESWDSMVNVVEATHTYVAKTGDLEFYRRHEAAVARAINWVRGLDLDDDGLPDQDIFPYGYTDTVENGPLHTYAIAKFYAGYLAMAALEEAVGRDGTGWREYAGRTKANFARPLAEGGYWNPETGHPIAWKRASGEVYTTFETFGVYEAIRVGLLTDPEQRRSISDWLEANGDAFLNGHSYPERLMIGGYDLRTRKAEVPMDKLWIMDCNAPWITGLSVPARVELGRLADARAMLDLYAASSHRSTPHAEFGASHLARFGPGETADGGRLWDNWSWFNAVYGTHFGLRMTIPALEIAPAPLYSEAGSHLFGVTYQGANVEMRLFSDGYQVTLGGAKRLLLKPPYGFRWIDVNGDGLYAPQRELVARPGLSYVIRAYR